MAGAAGVATVVGFLAAGTTGGFLAAVAGAGAAAFGGAAGVTGCFSKALTTPVCRAGVGFVTVLDGAAGTAATGAVAAGEAATGAAAAGCVILLALVAAVEPAPPRALVAPAHGDAPVALVAAAGAAALCPNSELILVIAAVVFETALAAPLCPAAPAALAVAVPQGWLAADAAPLVRSDIRAEPPAGDPDAGPGPAVGPEEVFAVSAESAAAPPGASGFAAGEAETEAEPLARPS